MADLERNHEVIKEQIVDTAEALKKASQDVLAEVIAAADEAVIDP